MNKLKKFFLSKREFIRGKIFDYRYNIRTQGFVTKDKLHTTSSYKLNATAYQEIGNSRMNKILRAYNNLNLNAKTFLDIGCGRGKACFYASLSGNFQHVMGIDFDENLIYQAKENLSQFTGDKNIDFSLADAADFTFDDPNTLVFMANPFDEVVLEKFIIHNFEKFRKGAVIAYAKDAEKTTLLRLSFKPLYQNSKSEISLWSL